ncbi:hypothetical protein SAMN02910456_02020 [Ruminococcaceae bacterium YRB3002]|nr:hypothetical protein SAMN02910456_02020 [Ruminococcaceae bacterium YRB3002]
MSEEKNEVKTTSKKPLLSDQAIEIITVILLGLTALLTAWASYVGSIHGGNQATNYAKSNNLSSDGNSLYNEAVSNMNQDMSVWNTIQGYQVAILYADSIHDNKALEENVWKLKWFCQDNLSEEMAAKINYDVEAFGDDRNDTQDILDWLYDDEGDALNSPFADEAFCDAYFADSAKKLDEASAVLVQGQQDNANGDKFTLVTVIYSVALFLLGIVGVFKNSNNKLLVLAISVVCLVVAIVFMVTIPLPASGGIFG